MKTRFNVSAVLDASGVIALIGSAVCLAGSAWFAQGWPAATFLGAFEICFGAGVACLLAARVFQIGTVIFASPNVASMRTAPVADAVVTLDSDTGSSDISRAA